MAKKKGQKTTGPSGEAVLAGFLIALASVGAIACFILGGIAFFNGRQGTADQAPAATVRGTLPSGSPTNTPASETAGPSNVPGQTTEPAEEQTQASAQTQVPAQSGGGTISNGDGTYTHTFSGGRVLITSQSDNNGEPVYHTKDCQAAKLIPPENEGWYDSAQAAIDAGRRLCGHCN